MLRALHKEPHPPTALWVPFPPLSLLGLPGFLLFWLVIGNIFWDVKLSGIIQQGLLKQSDNSFGFPPPQSISQTRGVSTIIMVEREIWGDAFYFNLFFNKTMCSKVLFPRVPGLPFLGKQQFGTQVQARVLKLEPSGCKAQLSLLSAG